MAERMAAYDWASLPLGPPETWPLSLQAAIRIALGSRFAMWLCWGPDLTFFCNDAYRPTLGVKRDWALGASARQVWGEIWDDIGPRIDTVLETGQATWDEGLLLYLERSGMREETYHTFSYSPLLDDDGSIAGMLCVVSEETSRVIGERRVEALSDIATALNSTLTETELFERVERVLDEHRNLAPFALIYLPDASTGSHTLAMKTGVSDAQRAVLAARPLQAWPIAQTMANSDRRLVGELRQRMGGAPLAVNDDVPVTALLMPIGTQGSTQAAGVFIAGLNPAQVFDDAYEDFLQLLVGQISAGLASARAFDAAQRRARELSDLDRAKTAFFSNVSHEFRTPLTLMLGPTEAAMESREGALAGPDLDLVHRNALRLLKLVNTLLDFSRIEAGRFEAHHEPTDLAAFTADLASVFRSAAGQAGLALIVDCVPLPRPVRIDREIWEKIVLNLLSNAFKYTHEGCVSVSLRTVGNHAVLRVRDTGIGIGPNELPHIFERFRRVRNRMGRSHEGTGIGLALARELVVLLGGTISATSTVDKGSEFTVSVPADREVDASLVISPSAVSASARSYTAEILQWRHQPQDRSADSAPLQPLAGSQVHKPRVLLADDNADMRAYITRILSERFDVVAVEDGLTALDSIVAEPPDLVLSDVMMPRMDGFELLRAMREDSSLASIPVLLLTARAGEEARIEGLQAGADDYLIKPFSARELVVRVGAALTLANTRRKAQRVEAQLRFERDKVLESINEGYLSVAPDWTITGVNSAAERMLGMTRTQLQGQAIWALYPGIRDSDYGAALRRGMEERVTLVFENFYEPWQKWFEVNIHPSSDEGITLYFREITERKNTLAALREADRRKDEFLATLAHELRNPLSPIASAAELLASGNVPTPTLFSASSIINRQVRHMARLLDDLLDVSRITTSKMELKKETVALDRLLDSAFETAQPLLRQRRHRIEIQRPPQPVTIFADPVRIAQVLSNLLTNAAKYTDPEGLITVAAEVSGEQLMLRVQDSGVGMSAQQLVHAFEMFSQVESSLSRSQGGLGIGLALVKGIVELHAGSIAAYSEGIGHGSRFELCLPVVVPDIPFETLAPASPIGPLPPPTRRKVLVADDNRDAAESLGMLFELEGHDVQVVHSGNAALAAMAAFDPEIVFLDIGMPDMNGFEVARSIRRTPSRPPVTLVALTGWGQPEDRHHARQAGFDLHLVKPADPAALRAIFRQL